MQHFLFPDGVYNPKQLANRLKLYREQQGWTQTDVAKRIGVKQATISNFENHPEKTQLATLFKITQAMGVVLRLHEPNSQLGPVTAANDEVLSVNEGMSDEDNW